MRELHLLQDYEGVTVSPAYWENKCDISGYGGNQHLVTHFRCCTDTFHLFQTLQFPKPWKSLSYNGHEVLF